MPLRSHYRLTADKKGIEDFPKLPSATSFIRGILSEMLEWKGSDENRKSCI